MKKPLKVLAKAAIGAGAAYLAVGEVMYEGALNIPLNHFIRRNGAFENAPHSP